LGARRWETWPSRREKVSSAMEDTKKGRPLSI
jgi:hypothetical protein